MAGYGNLPDPGAIMPPIHPSLVPAFLVTMVTFFVVLYVHRRSIREVLPWQMVVWLMWDDLLVLLHIREPRGVGETGEKP